MLEEFPGHPLVLAAFALCPALLAWWRGRALVQSLDDPALPERLLASQRRSGTELGVVFVLLAAAHPAAIGWTLPLLIGGLACHKPSSRATLSVPSICSARILLLSGRAAEKRRATMTQCGTFGTPRRFLGSAVLSILLLVGASPAQGEQFTIGSGTASGDDSGGNLNVAGADFSFSLFGESTGEVSNLGGVFCPHPCDPSTVTFTAWLSGFLGSGSAQIGATVFDNIDFHGSLDFRGGDTAVQQMSDGGGFVVGLFTFTGLFTGFQGGTQLFSHTATGGGQASLRFLPGIAVDGTSFTFQEPAPVPEPGTWLLLTGGAAAIAARRRRQRTRCVDVPSA